MILFIFLFMIVVSRVPTCRQTNNVAEIQAGVVAIRQAVVAERKKLVIHTDSQFLIDCVTKWMQGWKVGYPV